jgi:uncharacterized protein YqhQ
MEGVMMRGHNALAVAVRQPDGEIVMHTEPLDAKIYRGKLSKIPFLRALVSLWDVLVLGTRTLMWSASVSMGPEMQVEFTGPMAWGTLAFSLVLGVALFFVAPLLLTGLVEHQLHSSFLTNLVEGVIRMAIFIVYIWAIGRVPEIKRVFGYHGAEHKTINAYEDGAELTPKNVARYSTSHLRCGTAFLLSVMVFSVLFFALLGSPPILLRLLSRIVFIPVLAAFAYEFIKFTNRHRDNALVRALAVPNLALQKLTTREPDEKMLEVSIRALERVLEFDGLLVREEASSAEDKVADYSPAVL